MQYKFLNKLLTTSLVALLSLTTYAEATPIKSNTQTLKKAPLKARLAAQNLNNQKTVTRTTDKLDKKVGPKKENQPSLQAHASVPLKTLKHSILQRLKTKAAQHPTVNQKVTLTHSKLHKKPVLSQRQKRLAHVHLNHIKASTPTPQIRQAQHKNMKATQPSKLHSKTIKPQEISDTRTSVDIKYDLMVQNHHLHSLKETARLARQEEERLIREAPNVIANTRKNRETIEKQMANPDYQSRYQSQLNDLRTIEAKKTQLTKTWTSIHEALRKSQIEIDAVAPHSARHQALAAAVASAAADPARVGLAAQAAAQGVVDAAQNNINVSRVLPDVVEHARLLKVHADLLADAATDPDRVALAARAAAQGVVDAAQADINVSNLRPQVANHVHLVQLHADLLADHATNPATAGPVARAAAQVAVNAAQADINVSNLRPQVVEHARLLKAKKDLLADAATNPRKVALAARAAAQVVVDAAQDAINVSRGLHDVVEHARLLKVHADLLADPATDPDRVDPAARAAAQVVVDAAQDAINVSNLRLQVVEHARLLKVHADLLADAATDPDRVALAARAAAQGVVDAAQADINVSNLRLQVVEHARLLKAKKDLVDNPATNPLTASLIAQAAAQDVVDAAQNNINVSRVLHDVVEHARLLKVHADLLADAVTDPDRVALAARAAAQGVVDAAQADINVSNLRPQVVEYTRLLKAKKDLVDNPATDPDRVALAARAAAQAIHNNAQHDLDDFIINHTRLVTSHNALKTQESDIKRALADVEKEIIETILPVTAAKTAVSTAHAQETKVAQEMSHKIAAARQKREAAEAKLAEFAPSASKTSVKHQTQREETSVLRAPRHTSVQQTREERY